MHGDKGHVTRLCRRAAVTYEYMLCYVQVGRGPTVIGQPSRLMCVRLSLQRGWSRLPSLSPASAPKAGVWDTSRPCVTHIHTNTQTHCAFLAANMHSFGAAAHNTHMYTHTKPVAYPFTLRCVQMASTSRKPDTPLASSTPSVALSCVMCQAPLSTCDHAIHSQRPHD